MERQQPMDRLLCGDVGFGKTEVAIRAAFKSVMDGRQVAIIVPTTVLAQQHFKTFTQRMADYPVSIEMLSRFVTKKEQTKTLERLAKGEVDIVIGTHRLLQRDIFFAKLGLVVIDEEQRFGVKAKEMLKVMRSMVDILTMTATPIPRTLHLSLAGLRDLSTIMTPPMERKPVKTIVSQEEDEIIRQSILREIERGGQVYYLHNRVQTIEKRFMQLARLVPEAKFAYGHGRMDETELEIVMDDFVQQKVDVLVSTTIIESGLDIPNANTIFIERADRFGLAELYQLRGRVGRYHQQAYCYLLLPKGGMLIDTAKQRLSAIRRYTHLGAGFKLALRDLEIRGTGNLLGSEQSGHIAAVGFELYCQLLQDTVNKLDNRPQISEIQTILKLDFISLALGAETSLVAAITPEYIEDESLRIEFYKRLSRSNTEKAVDGLEKELRDRFGPIPDESSYLILWQRIKVRAHRSKVHRITNVSERLMIEGEEGYWKKNGKFPTLKAKTAEGKLEEVYMIMKKL